MKSSSKTKSEFSIDKFPRGTNSDQSRPDPGGAPAVRITEWCGRFGNNSIQISNAIYLAQELGIKYVKHPPHALFRGRVIESGVNFGSHPGLSGRFFYGRSLLPYLPPLPISRRKQILLENLRPKLTWLDMLKPSRIRSLKNESTLVIHIRSGDVFSAKPHRGYVQPPFYYYRTIIENNSWGDIILVCEDTRNPVVNRLFAEYPDIHLHSSILTEDFSVLCHSRNLVGSNGTFTHAAFCLNVDIRRYWIPGLSEQAGMNFTAAFPDQAIVVRCPNYIKIGDWINTPEQRRIMLDYNAPL